jgi:hypothetical protein
MFRFKKEKNKIENTLLKEIDIENIKNFNEILFRYHMCQKKLIEYKKISSNLMNLIGIYNVQENNDNTNDMKILRNNLDLQFMCNHFNKIKLKDNYFLYDSSLIKENDFSRVSVIFDQNVMSKVIDSKSINKIEKYYDDIDKIIECYHNKNKNKNKNKKLYDKKNDNYSRINEVLEEIKILSKGDSLYEGKELKDENTPSATTIKSEATKVDSEIIKIDTKENKKKKIKKTKHEINVEKAKKNAEKFLKNLSEEHINEKKLTMDPYELSIKEKSDLMKQYYSYSCSGKENYKLIMEIINQTPSLKTSSIRYENIVTFIEAMSNVKIISSGNGDNRKLICTVFMEEIKENIRKEHSNLSENEINMIYEKLKKHSTVLNKKECINVCESTFYPKHSKWTSDIIKDVQNFFQKMGLTSKNLELIKE